MNVEHRGGLSRYSAFRWDFFAIAIRIRIGIDSVDP